MDHAARTKILNLLESHRIMTVATNRPDGWPQATTVGFGHDGLILYFLCSAQSQKAANLRRDDRVSITIDSDTHDPMAIRGLSMAAHVTQVKDQVEIRKVIDLLLGRYPEYRQLEADVSLMLVMRVVPKVISILDYSKGFGHTDLVGVQDEDFRAAA